MSTTLPPMLVTFDDGTDVMVIPKQRDMVGAEAAGHDFTKSGRQVAGMWAVAYAALQRMARSNTLPDGLVLPDTLQAFIDGADVNLDETEGKD